MEEEHCDLKFGTRGLKIEYWPNESPCKTWRRSVGCLVTHVDSQGWKQGQRSDGRTVGGNSCLGGGVKSNYWLYIISWQDEP